MSSSNNNSENEMMVIHQKLNEQSQELNELRRALAALNGNRNGHRERNGDSFLDVTESSSVTDRRGMLKKVAGLAVGVATVGLLQPTGSKAVQGTISKTGVPSTDGDPWMVGTDENAESPTGLHNSTATLIATQLNVRNYGTADFVHPPNTNIAIVGYANTAGGPTNTNDIVGIWGEGRGGGVGIGGRFVGDNTGVIVEAGRATFCLFSTDETFPPTSANSHVFGEVVVSTDYSMWYSFGTPATFRRVGGPALTANDLPTAGAFSLLKAPKRLVDTRTGSGFFDAGNHYGSDTLRTYNIISLAGASFLPARVSAIVGRITVANATGPGGLQESPNPPPGAGNDLGFGTAVISFPIASTIPSFGVPIITALDSSGNIRVHSIMGAGGSVDVIIDITGYYI